MFSVGLEIKIFMDLKTTSPLDLPKAIKIADILIMSICFQMLWCFADLHIRLLFGNPMEKYSIDLLSGTNFSLFCFPEVS